jgi:2-oxo-4-hydroxy-4-carboxy--5-ureidoimidazoline (OHCU) decarboxylase
MRELPRQLTVEELAELFSGRTRLVERLAAVEDPLGSGFDAVVAAVGAEEKEEALAAHPRIGEASTEQRGDEPQVQAELAALNRAYEEQFGFRFVVFVDRRSRAELLPVLRERLGRPRADELDTGLTELVAIARDRWRQGDVAK